MHEADLRFDQLQREMTGELFTDAKTRCLYATDASLYEELPKAVATPASDQDISALIRFANVNRIGLIPRTAGTSLAGQAVGPGIVVDVSKHLTAILEVDREHSRVRVQPGVIRDDLNRELAQYKLFFAPETSTANRAMIGGMIGNNSSGANSIVYGDTRSHVLELTGFLGDGSKVSFGPINANEVERLNREQSSLGRVYRTACETLSDENSRLEILHRFPKTSIHRRNTGYALDALTEAEFFGGNQLFNFCNLLTGSEGTLFFITEATLNCVEIPSNESTLVCGHFRTIDNALRANTIAMEWNPSRCELMDHFIISGIRENRISDSGIVYLSGDPAAILMIEFKGPDHDAKAKQLADKLKSTELGYHFPLLSGDNATKAWNSRKAALGGLSNVDREKTAVTIIEDAAVDVNDLPKFVAEVLEFVAADFGTDCVVYGHAGAGELHLRPWLNLNDPHSKTEIRSIATQFAHIVKRYRGALSGEHGSGRSRSEFIEFMVGENCYRLMQQIKTAFDPNNIFNPGKIVNAVPIDANLRVGDATEAQRVDKQESLLRFAEGSMLKAAARCSGSGDCRKSHLAAGAMCPSYQATRNESESTRGRANLLRQFLAKSSTPHVTDLDVKDILDLCLSCKACKSECPSNVDMAKIKAEFTHQFESRHGRSLRSRLLANFEVWCERARSFGMIGKFAARNSVTSRIIKQTIGIHPSRKLPDIQPQSLRSCLARRSKPQLLQEHEQVFLFCDEFTNQIDVKVGLAAFELLEELGYEVILLDNVESGRSAISVGNLPVARKLAEENVRRLHPIVAAQKPIIGIEPSAILTLRDEYPDLVGRQLQSEATQLAKSVLTIDEFIANEVDKGNITQDQFKRDTIEVRFHGHCHQKALSSTSSSLRTLALPAGSEAREISSGCCGMAGFFGYDREKFDLSQQIGELVLFPAVRKVSKTTIIAATGTSCRQQIFDATGVEALHPIEVLRRMLKSR